jgi:ABC-type transporter Mla subunit MlaD
MGSSSTAARPLSSTARQMMRSSKSTVRLRLSGVEVGTLTDIEVVDEGGRKLARLEFTVDEAVPVYRDAQLELRFESDLGPRDEVVEAAAVLDDDVAGLADRPAVDHHVAG